MFAQHRPPHHRARRRGVVLILILAMLSLLAVIGISFATLSGQAQLGARKQLESLSTPTSDDVMDYALSQLINDTNNPLSAIRGHSLKRDMYGNDAFNNGAMSSFLSGGTQTALQFNGTGTPPGSLAGYPCLTTNIPWDQASTYGLRFTRWIVKYAVCTGWTADGQPVGQTVPPVMQTFEVLSDDNSGGFHVLTLSFSDTTTRPTNAAGTTVPLADPANYPGQPFFLDGRYLRAFNGEGMTSNAASGNFLYNGLNPDLLGMDEDYDAPDLENWYLALQSADGNVVIPSFHRPGILDPTTDWTSTANTSRAKILRVRSGDHPASGGTFGPEGVGGLLVPDNTGTAATNSNFGKIKYDVDNDGDGVTDSVWVDLGYPAQRDATGKLYKPLFAFTVLGLNGRLPLNTVGNLQGRFLVNDADELGNNHVPGDPTFNHASHLGSSVNEISPLYALQNTPDVSVAQSTNSQFDNAGVAVSVTQLRNLLTGTRIPATTASATIINNDNNSVLVGGTAVAMGNNLLDSMDSPGSLRTTASVAGRWGEEGFIPNVTTVTPSLYNFFNNLVRAGRSNTLPMPSPTYPLRVEWDASDDDFDTFDFYGSPNPENVDFTDNAGGYLLPSERIRRYVKPIDPVGTGRMATTNQANITPTNPAILYSKATGTQNGYGSGPDDFGRIAYWGYFRPPGLVDAVSHSAYDSNATLGTPTVPDLTSNPLHGFEAERYIGNPAGLTFNTRAGMPINNGPGTSLPTFIGPINSDPTSPPSAINGYPLGSLNRDEADEMNLYQASPYDSPFGPEDLEWLYRAHDVDGVSLNSRLSKLAPISFMAAGDSLARRRMFSIDSWETTNFVYSHDNPGGSFPNNAHFAAGINLTGGNPNLLTNGSTNPLAWDPNPARLVTVGASLLNWGVGYTGGSPNGPGAPTPSLAHRDRKINLNYPFPVSNSPIEPVRQKWIREVYEFLKLTLPPESVDTPQELAQLSQYVVNIVDFRDPDGAMTKFVNTDLVVTPAVAPSATSPLGSPPTLSASSPPSNPYDPTLDPNPTNDPTYTPAAGTILYLVQYGMEYNPIALNEVLAYSFLRKDPGGGAAGIATPRLFVELINLLTQAGTTPEASDINLNGWELRLVAESQTQEAALGATGEDFTCRPDPITGQMPLQPAAGGGPASPKQIVMPLLLNPAATGTVTAPSQLASGSTHSSGGLKVLVLSNALAVTTSENINAISGATGTPNYNPILNGILTRSGVIPFTAPNTPPSPTPTPSDDPMALPGTGSLPGSATIKQLGSGKGKYYWLYLRRPANPLAPNDINNPKVVVDAIRFPYIEGGGVPSGGSVNRTNNNEIYSVQRRQPYRGGQLLDHTGTPTPPIPATAYGFSEQSVYRTPPTSSGNNLFGVYQDPTSGKYYQITGRNGATPPTGPIALTQGAAPANGAPAPFTAGDGTGIAETLGVANTSAESWALFPFHDRDFMSVAEMLLVPGCPPGLFTKQFVEGAPPIVQLSNTPYTSLTTPITAVPSSAVALTHPHSYPYLPDQFYYTAYGNQVDTAVGGPLVGGPTGAGWHRMLGFFEVPSSANGAIGPVASGQNFDWYRQDIKPGLLNLNLIIDEEVFFGLIDDPLRMDLTPMASGNQPLVATQSNLSTYYPMNNKGFTYWMDATGGFPKFATNASTDMPQVVMKKAFNDFLGLRHSVQVVGGQPYAVLGSSQAERPFHDITYPDINYTVMRPALLPPLGAATTPYTGGIATPTPPTYFSVPRDPGLKVYDPDFGSPPPPSPPGAAPGPYTGPAYTVGAIYGPPPVPTRRIFEIPGENQTAGSGLYGDTNYNPISSAGLPTAPPIIDLSAGKNTTTGVDVWLGGSSVPGVTDRRQHPAYRIEWLQKVMNLTTVRTHQYATWVTVGFFEVTVPGNAGNPNASPPVPPTPDQLGMELGVVEGTNVRYRSFFVLDRTRATGFNPQAPGDFRQLILYRRRIE